MKLKNIVYFVGYVGSICSFFSFSRQPEEKVIPYHTVTIHNKTHRLFDLVLQPETHTKRIKPNKKRTLATLLGSGQSGALVLRDRQTGETISWEFAHHISHIFILRSKRNPAGFCIKNGTPIPP
jgi:hypothetical protein